jgi:hypothetical protein
MDGSRFTKRQWSEINPILNVEGGGDMYFCIDEKNRKIVNDSGDVFTAEQFKTIIQRNSKKNKVFDMTLAVQRLISFDFNWDRLSNFYDSES